MGNSISDKLKRLVCEALAPSLAAAEERDRRIREELDGLRARLVAVTEHSNRMEAELAKSLALQQEMIEAMTQLEERLVGELENGFGSSVKQIDKQIEWWTWDRFKRTDKQIERWTWERYRRSKKDTNSFFWNIQYEEKRKNGLVESYNGKLSVYDDLFYFNNRFGSVLSARKILGFLLNKLDCNSMIDYGCGTGTWLWVALGYGVSEVCGIDGAYVPENMLMIPKECFVVADLSKPYSVAKKYDLALSLEVAEHIPKAAAEILIDNICKSADVVLFSAAHPGQGGDEHVNEQPVSYWIERFKARHYIPIEIRPFFKQDSDIETWYRENMVLFVIENKALVLEERIGLGED